MANFLTGNPERVQQFSNLNVGQQNLQNQMLMAMRRPGAGGGFGQAADYFRDLLDPSGQAAQAFAAPMMRQFQQDIIPGLAEQFAGMGSGGLSSSSFRNAGVGAGADLMERLSAMRAGLRQQGAQGMLQLGGMSMQPTTENILRPATGGMLGGMAGGAGQGLGQFLAMLPMML